MLIMIRKILFYFIVLFYFFSLYSQDENYNQDYYSAITEATKQYIFQNFDLSENLYKEIIKNYPESDAAYFQLSKIYTYRGQIDLASKYAYKAEILDTTNFYYLMNEVNIYKATENSDSLISVLERLVNRFEDKPDYATALLNIYFKKEQYEEAIVLSKIIKSRYGLKRENLAIELNSLEKLGRYEEGVKLLKNNIKNNPANLDYKYELGRYYLLLDKYKKSENIYKNILNENPDETDAILSLSVLERKKENINKSYIYLEEYIKSDKPQNKNKNSIIYSFIKDDNISKNEFKNIARIIDTNIKYNYGFNTIALGYDYYIRFDSISTAIDYMEKLIKLDSSSGKLWEKLVYHYYQEDMYDSLFQKTNIAIKKFPEEPKYYMLNGMAAIQIDSNKKAINTLTTVLNKEIVEEEDLPLLYSFLGDAYHNTDKHWLSDKYYELVIKYEPNNCLVKNNYSYYLALRNEKLEKAYNYSKYCIKKHRKQATFLDTHAWVLYKMGEYRKAKRYLKRAERNLEEENAEIYEHLGDVYIKLDKKEKALNYYNKANSISESLQLKKKINKLQNK